MNIHYRHRPNKKKEKKMRIPQGKNISLAVNIFAVRK
jgi:hypothetical protein